MSPSGPCRLSPATPAGFAELLIRNRIDRALARTGDAPRDLGASVVEWVIISALLVAIAVAVGAVLLQKLTAKANSIDLDAGTP
jgi:adenylosuccinate lyase